VLTLAKDTRRYFYRQCSTSLLLPTARQARDAVVTSLTELCYGDSFCRDGADGCRMSVSIICLLYSL
jgi:hypothetical protein